MAGSCVGVASAPGKVILIGEHAAVYGAPAVVAALDLRTEAAVELESHPGSAGAREVRLELPDLGIASALDVLEVDHVLSALQESVAPADAEGEFQSLEAHAQRLGPPWSAALLFVLIAVDRAARAAGTAGVASSGVCRVCIRSAAPLGSGCGSSAAVALSVAAATGSALLGAGHHDALTDLQGLERLAFEVECFQHGTPSGVDTATVTRGGVSRMRRSDGALEVTPIRVRNSTLEGFRLIHTGSASESTGAVVGAVRTLRSRETRRVDGLFERIARASDRLVELLESEPEAADHEASVAALIREAQRCLDELGIVPDPVRDLVQEIETRGAVAKVSGAGSLLGPGAGILLVYDPARALDDLRLPPQTRTLETGPLGGAGLQILDPRCA